MVWTQTKHQRECTATLLMALHNNIIPQKCHEITAVITNDTHVSLVLQNLAAVTELTSIHGPATIAKVMQSYKSTSDWLDKTVHSLPVTTTDALLST